MYLKCARITSDYLGSPHSEIQLLQPLPCLATNSKQMRIIPSKRLQKCLVLGKLFYLDVHVTADGKAVDDARVQVNLVWLLGLEQNLLGLVTLVSREDAVRFSSSNGQRTRNGCKLIFFDKAGVSNVANVDAVFVVANNILPSVSISLSRNRSRNICAHTFAPKQYPEEPILS